MRLTDALDGLGVRHPLSDDILFQRRARKPARRLIDADKATPKRRQRPLPNAHSFLVRVAAVLRALEAHDRDCVRGELSRLAADCERWADSLATSRTLDQPED